MEFTAQIIANYLGGTIDGDPDVKVTTVAKIEEGFPGALSFLANPKYEPYIYTTKSSIVLVNDDFVAEQPITTTLIRVKNAYEAFASLLDLYAQSKQPKSGVEQPSYIHESAKIGADAYIGAFSYIAEGVSIGDNVKIYPQVYIGPNVKIGNNVTLYPGVVIYEECIIGNSCMVHSGAIIGADGFGFASGADTNYKKIPQIGNVIVEDYVEIGANATIDRATMGSTILRKGVKIDDHVHIAHNVEIGENTVMAAQTGVAGSTKVGKNCMFGGQVGVSPHVKVADEVKVGAQSGISGDIRKPGTILLGSPAIEISKERRSSAVYRNLPELMKKVSELERTVQELLQKLDNK
ncbi:MAG: UDP-3-O-[3-hydroxymyristoyl] glucosamine N-acyltransferase [Tenuifilum sp.]|jgi:UDP-3-O-[3-hydroxymyristoyl] glucosamine N-acyltransferase|uniref:UDP-3-O-(3-hydroxymyristoyl)glucosamine N-acyltransferase n=1 Tax=Tenuifilum sp. TaxID=2760880 RepID=UPI0024AA8D13|nr:UDP-3-O-(3-hydroxymyristoyl)glucosamine N-acyltransferase [Tenuifilum sp.]MDI3527305.1 UDP-3-O-[3-hydroxymyristoyl] glucosamine N-acyltransferase [Tenuifilum sp.]